MRPKKRTLFLFLARLANPTTSNNKPKNKHASTRCRVPLVQFVGKRPRRRAHRAHGKTWLAAPRATNVISTRTMIKWAVIKKTLAHRAPWMNRACQKLPSAMEKNHPKHAPKIFWPATRVTIRSMESVLPVYPVSLVTCKVHSNPFFFLWNDFIKTSSIDLSICFLNDFHQEQSACCANKDIINQWLDKKKHVKNVYHPIPCVKTRPVQSQQSPPAIVLNRQAVLICLYPLVTQKVLKVTISTRQNDPPTWKHTVTRILTHPIVGLLKPVTLLFQSWPPWLYW